MSAEAPPPLRQTRTAIRAFAAIVCVLIIAATALILAGKSAGDLLAVLGVAATPVVVGLLALMKADTAHTKDLANGNLSELRKDLMDLARLLAAAQPVTQLAVTPQPTPPQEV